MSEPSIVGRVDAGQVNDLLRAMGGPHTVTCVELSPTAAVAQLAVTETALRPGGFISGPAQFSLIDGALWFATFGAIGRIEPMAMTSELSVRFLRPAQGSILWCRATVEAANRRSVVATAHVWCDDRPDRVTATAQGTYALPLPR